MRLSTALADGFGWENAPAIGETTFAFEFAMVTVPEPSVALLHAAALFGLIVVRRRPQSA